MNLRPLDAIKGTATPPGTAPPPSPGPPGGTISPELSRALSQLAAAYAELQAASRSGDLTRISTAQAAVNQAAAAVAAAQGRGSN